MDTGNRIKQIRQMRGMSQRALAEAIGIKQQQIAQYESGTRRPKFYTVQRIAEALDCGIMDLVPNNDSFDKADVVDELIFGGVERQVVENMRGLNSDGKTKVLEYSRDMLKIWEYCGPEFDAATKIANKKSGSESPKDPDPD